MEATGAAAERAPGAAARARRSPAQLLCAGLGAFLVARGVGGLLFGDTSFDTPGEGWHTIVHLVSGIALLAAALAGGARAAALGALAFGVVYGAVAVLGIAGDGDVLGIVPTQTEDNAFHSVIAAASAIAGIVSLRR